MSVRIPNYCDEENYIYFFNQNEFLVGLTVIFIGLMTDLQWQAFLASFVISFIYRKITDDAPLNYLRHFLYIKGLEKLDSRIFPEPFAKDFYK